jgi:hypothetical protein
MITASCLKVDDARASKNAWRRGVFGAILVQLSRKATLVCADRLSVAFDNGGRRPARHYPSTRDGSRHRLL